jgi:hypothetical protein
MQDKHFLGSVLEQVAHGIIQLRLHVKAEFKKYPVMHDVHPVGRQVLQFYEQALHVSPER